MIVGTSVEFGGAALDRAAGNTDTGRNAAPVPEPAAGRNAKPAAGHDVSAVPGRDPKPVRGPELTECPLALEPITLRLVLRNAWMYLVGFLATAYFVVGVNVHYVLRTPVRERFAERAPARWGALLLRLAKVKAVWENPERLRPGQAQILVANHQSWFDVFALAGTLPVKFSMVGKKELSRIPFFGTAWARVGHYAVDRSDYKAAMASLDKAGERIASDATTVVMFPEGTRSPTGELARFKRGAFVLAISAQAPVVPVAVLGTRRVMAKGRWLVRPGTVTIRVAPPISTKGMTIADRDKLVRRARDEVAALMEQGATACRP